MFERLLLGILSLGLPDQSQPEDNAVPTEKALSLVEKITCFQNAAKLHVGMLSCSLIIGLAFGGYVAYSCWREKNNFRAMIRNLVIAFVCRIFFSILFDGVVILGSDATASGANALLALECLSQNFVIAFWLLLTVYLHAWMQRHFNSEPTLTVYEYGIPGVAVFFAFVWIFVMQSEFPSIPWWIILSYLPQWIVSSLRLLYLLIQLGFVADMGTMMMKSSLDNDSVSLLRKSAAVLVVLILLFWLQFGFSLGRLPPLKSQSYQYFDSFIDGSLGGFVCLLLFFFDLWVPKFLNRMPSIMAESEGAPKRTQEILLTEGRGIETIDKVFKTKDSGRWKTLSDPDAVAEFRDVMYSTVVEPHRLMKTLDLYKRLNVLPNSQATVLDGEKFYDCQIRRSMMSETGDSEKADFRSVISDDSRSVTRENSRSKTPKLSEQVQKKNAFYASKYLILDSKEDDFPKFLETRPWAEKKSTKEESDRDFFSNFDRIIPDELVNKWLNDNSMDLRRKSRPEEPHRANAGVPNEDLVQQSNTTSHQKPGRTAGASESTTAETLILMETEVPHRPILNKRKLSGTDKSDWPIELPKSIPKQAVEATDSLGKEEPQVIERNRDQKPGSTAGASESTTAETLILMETEVPHRPILHKRKLSGTDKSDSPIELPRSIPKQAVKATDSLGKKEPQVIERQAKRIKSAKYPGEHLSKPVQRRQRNKPTPLGRVETPLDGKVQSTESNAASSTPTASLPSSESPLETQARFSDVIYSTFNSLLGLGDGLFKPRSSIPELDDIHKDKSAMFEGKTAGEVPKSTEGSIPTKAQTLNAAGPFIAQSRIEKIENENLRKPIFEEQSLKIATREEPKEQGKPCTVQMQRPQERRLQATVTSKAETVTDDSSSESTFCIERKDSRGSFSVDEYYARLMANREKFNKWQ